MEHLVIPPHLLAKGLQQRFGIGEFTHDRSSVGVGLAPSVATHRTGAKAYEANTSNRASSGRGKGLDLAKSIAFSTACCTSLSICSSCSAVATPCACKLEPK